jgi:hypothetical protein
LDQKVDGIILIQCIGFIPDADISVLQKHLEKCQQNFVILENANLEVLGMLNLRNYQYWIRLIALLVEQLSGIRNDLLVGRGLN